MIAKNISLKTMNSFAINAYAHQVITVHNEVDLLHFTQSNSKDTIPFLVLGDGSNVLFLENYIGTVLLNRIYGINIHETIDAWYLHIGAGEIWHNLVITCLEQCMPGLENLALIPGRVGAAPIQNIGAYGVELNQLCEYVDVLELKTGIKNRLNIDECKFGYRDSIFKHDLRDGYIILAVGLKLTKLWHPILKYGSLSQLRNQNVTPKQIYNIVCNTRRKIIPNPVLIGNSGSFFKNPIINIHLAKLLLDEYPNLPHYYHSDNTVKISAGWLIDQCGLKGYRLGAAAVHKEQALILLNIDNANGMDIIKLARYIRQKVAERFNIFLEPEVRLIGSYGEINALEVIV